MGNGRDIGKWAMEIGNRAKEMGHRAMEMGHRKTLHYPSPICITQYSMSLPLPIADSPIALDEDEGSICS
jgi:hypothetical protein